jgi:hypothetical protein
MARRKAPLPLGGPPAALLALLLALGACLMPLIDARCGPRDRRCRFCRCAGDNPETIWPSPFSRFRSALGDDDPSSWATEKHEPGYCAMYDICGHRADGDVLACANNTRAAPPSGELAATLQAVCPTLWSDLGGMNGTYCCTPRQVEVLANNVRGGSAGGEGGGRRGVCVTGTAGPGRRRRARTGAPCTCPQSPW